MIHSVLQHIHDVVLKVILVTYHVDLHDAPMMQSMIECYNVIGGPDDGDDPRNINILEIEGRWDIASPKILIEKINQ